MIIYLNQYNETIWHNKENCEQDLSDCFNENLSLGEVAEYDSSIMQNVFNLCEAAHKKYYVNVGQAIARLLQIYERIRDEFYNDFYITVEADKEKMKNEITDLLESGYTWGDEECDAED